jgi:hypothetical protein
MLDVVASTASSDAFLRRTLMRQSLSRVIHCRLTPTKALAPVCHHSRPPSSINADVVGCSSSEPVSTPSTDSHLEPISLSWLSSRTEQLEALWHYRCVDR